MTMYNNYNKVKTLFVVKVTELTPPPSTSVPVSEWRKSLFHYNVHYSIFGPNFAVILFIHFVISLVPHLAD